ncbi:hypothetical protein [Streptomyces sp. NBC_01244]|uniref:hypothetical protein n=1 Tax=Streptomyces sp. NBC_01244 TaxID=2903797 RepID=UPI002E1596E9|nr:hypothetical protein OG247_34190 [Streptomyces sp. NBC_01244]
MSDTTPQPEVTDLGAIPGTGGSATQPELSGIPVTEIEPDSEIGLTQVPAAEVAAEDVGTLSIRYIGTVPQLVVTGGNVVPSLITVVDGSGTVLAEYAGRPASAQARSQTIELNLFQDSLVLTGTGPEALLLRD